MTPEETSLLERLKAGLEARDKAQNDLLAIYGEIRKTIGLTAEEKVYGLTPDVAILCVASEYCLPKDWFDCKSRREDLVWARQVAMWLLYKGGQLSSQAIGGFFGKRDHGTVLHACQRVEAMLKTHPVRQAEIERIKGRLGQMLQYSQKEGEAK